MQTTKAFGIGLITGLVFFLPGVVFFTQAADPLRATIELKDNRSNVVFLLEANDKAILWQYTPDNPASTTTQLADIINIEFEDPEGWAEAMALYRAGKYAEAGPALGKIGDDYKGIVTLKGNPAARAKFLQLESYRKGGMYPELATALTDETKAGLLAALDERTHLQLGLNSGWSAVGTSDWQAVDALIAENSDDGFLKALAPRYLTQLTFMRGLSRIAKDEMGPARQDFYRTASLGFGNDVGVSGQAIRKVMDMLLADPKLTEDRARLRQLHGVTFLYKSMFGKGTVPAGFEDYTEILPASEGGEEVAPVEEAAPEEGEPAAPGEGETMPAEGSEAPAEGGGEPVDGETAGESEGSTEGSEEEELSRKEKRKMKSGE